MARHGFRFILQHQILQVLVIQQPGARGLFGGGYDAPANKDVIDYINISINW